MSDTLSDKNGSWTGAFPAGFWTRLEEGDKVHTRSLDFFNA
jgi:hypothetical protein